MSTTSYRLLVAFLLCISLLLCDARRLRPIEKKLETKNGEENGKAKTPKSNEKTTVSSTKGSLTETDKSKWLNVHAKVAADEGHKNANAKTKKEDPQDGTRTLSDETTSSTNSVTRSWKVPQKNSPKEEHPGFNLDYMQPVTHPPHHN